MYYPRYTAQNIEAALEDTPVVFIMGPRQVGKTTLARALVDETWGYVTLDDQTQFESAQSDPIGFVRNLPQQRVVLDEIQRVPELFLAIKQVVDENRTNTRFLLTGSANALLLPKLADSLAGRMETIPIKALSECEINGTEPTFLAKLLEERPIATKTVRVRETLVSRLVTGCFPEPLQRGSEQRNRPSKRL